MRRTWQIMKEITGKCKVSSNRFPTSINVTRKSIKKNNLIAEEFNKYFTNLARKIQNTSKAFYDFLFPVQKNMEHKVLPFEEFEKVSRIFKVGNIEEIGNHRPISVLPIFSKVLKRIMYNRTDQYFKENDMFFPKQFGFQVNNSTHHAILNLTDDILTSFEKGQFTLGVFIDL